MSVIDETEFQSQPSVDVSDEMDDLFARADRFLQPDAELALKVLKDIMLDKNAPPEARVQAATYVVNAAAHRQQFEEYKRQQSAAREASKE
jgi:hypothetical protein